MQFETALLALLASATSADAARVFGLPTTTSSNGRNFGGAIPATSVPVAGAGALPWYCPYFPALAACKPVSTTTTSSSTVKPTVKPTTTTSQTLVLRSTSRTADATSVPAPAQDTATSTQATTTAPTAASIQALSFPYQDQQPFIDAMLSSHNDYRKRHGNAPLTWNKQLSASALNWANGRSWSHTPNNANGENLATGTYTNPAYYVFMWYDEVKQYDYSNPGFSEQAGHYTQVVWNATTQVGCAMTNTATQQLPDYTYYLVCEYSPPGNIVNPGYFQNNVYQPLPNYPYPAPPAQFLQ